MRVNSLVMLTAIQLNDQHFLDAEKIHDVAADSCLPPELCARQPAITNRQPKALLDVRLLTPETRGVWADLTTDWRHGLRI